MTFSPYGEAIYGETFYGVPPSSNNLTTSFDITPIGYNGLQIDWTLPPGDWTSQVLVRSSFGTPTNIYAEDGVTLLFETNPVHGYSSQFVDVGLASGYFYYYALFVFNVAGGLDQWQLAGSAQGLVLTDYNFAGTYEGFIPDWYLALDQNLATTAQPDGPLNRFLQLFGYETDWLRSEIESFFLFTNPQLISGALLPYLGANYGMTYEPELGMARYRVLVENAVALYKSRGTGDGIAAAASAFTGYGAVVTRGKNLEIQLDDSAFDRSVGHWKPTTEGTEMSIVSATSQGVTPPHVSYIPVPADLTVDAALGVNGYLPANNENIALIETFGAVYWTEQPFSTAVPPGRSIFNMVYYPPTETMILFGGLPAGGGYLDDMWSWNGTTWTQLFPTNMPSIRFGYSMAYYPGTELIYLYGGYDAATGNVLDDMWSWNGTNWTELTGVSTPGPLVSASMVYDGVSEKLLLFGGRTAIGYASGSTWLWNGTAWSLGSTTGPFARYNLAMAYYPSGARGAANSVVLFGGFDPSGGALNDTWEWNGTTWTEVFPSGPLPVGRVGQSLVYDPNAGLLILFGGAGGADIFDDTWTWNGVQWLQVDTLVNPPGRCYFGIEWFSPENVFYIFGGQNGGYNYTTIYDDFWAGSFIESPPISITTCMPVNATTLGIPIEQVATPPQVVVSASFTPTAEPNPVLRYVQMQIDWYTQNGSLLYSTVGAPIQEVAGEWIRPYAVGSPPPGAYYYGRTVNMTSLEPPYIPPPTPIVPIPPPPPYVPPIVGITPTIILGGRTGYADLTDQAAFITSLGSDPTKSVLLEFLGPLTSWADIWDTVGGFTNFNQWTGPKAIKLPLQVTATPGLWTDVLNGGQDANLTAFFEFCVQYNVQHIMPMWEFNQIQATWPWGILDQDTAANQANFRNTWIHAWNIANTVAPGFFIWWWQPSAFCYENFTDAAPGGPYRPGTGSTYVDVIGMDVYNTYNAGSSFPGDTTMLSNFLNGNTVNWTQCLNYALANKLDMGVSEWGMDGGSGPNGGDDATYVSNFWNEWVTAAIALAPNGNKIYVFPWNNTGASPFSSYPTYALPQLITSVGASITAGYVAPPATASTPAITSVAPVSGVVAGGTSVVITGTNFVNVDSVHFGSVAAASYVVNSSTQITAVTPAESAGVVNVTVVTGGGISNSIAYTFGSTPSVPTVTAVSPTSGTNAGGTAVTITGTNLTGATAVKFGSKEAASFTVNSATQITATAPGEGAGLVDVTVTTPGGTSATSSADHFTFTSPSGIVPAFSPSGGVGALLFDSDFSTLSNQSGPGPMWASTPGSTDNDITGNSNDAYISGNQLILELSSNNVGGQVTTCPDGTFPTPSNGGFQFKFGYVEASLVIPTGNWWAVWLSGDPWPTKGEFDIVENGGSGAVLETNAQWGSTPGVNSNPVHGGTYPNMPYVGETVVIGGLWNSSSYQSFINGLHQITVSNGEDGLLIGQEPLFLLLTMGQYEGPIPAYLAVNYVRVWALP